MKFSKVISFQCGDLVGVRVEFLPHVAPGVTHKVLLVNRGTIVAKDWLSSMAKPNAKSAEFFFEKYKAKVTP